MENMETDADSATAAFCTARQQLVSVCLNIITNCLCFTRHISVIK